MTNDKTKFARLSRLVLSPSAATVDRPQLKASLIQLVKDALAWRLIAEVPKLINVVGFNLRLDLGLLGDLDDLKWHVDSASGRVAGVPAKSSLKFARTMATGEAENTVLVALRFFDVAVDVPPDTPLRDIGDKVGLPKLEIEAQYSIKRMEEYLREQPKASHARAMRDAETAVKYAMCLASSGNKN